MFYGAGLMWGRQTHLALAEYWRWWVVHLWVEGFFEVFATAVIAFLFTKLGLIPVRRTRTICSGFRFHRARIRTSTHPSHSNEPRTQSQSCARGPPKGGRMPVSGEQETWRRLSRPRTAGYSRGTALPAHAVEAKEKLVNDRHPSETPAPAPAPDADYAPYGSYDQQGAQHVGYPGYDGYSTGTFSTTGFNAPDGYDATGGFDTSGSGFAVPTAGFATDPLFGDMPGGHDTGQWSTTGTQQTLTYDAYAAQPGYDTGTHDTTAAWGTSFQPLSEIPAQPGPDSGATWDATAWNESPATGQWATQVFDTGAYDATAWNSGGHDAYDNTPQHDAYEPAHQHDAYGVPQQHDAYEAHDTAYDPQDGYAVQDPYEAPAPDPEAYGSGDPAYDSDDAPHAFLPDEAPDDRLGGVEPATDHAEHGDRDQRRQAEAEAGIEHRRDEFADTRTDFGRTAVERDIRVRVVAFARLDPVFAIGNAQSHHERWAGQGDTIGVRWGNSLVLSVSHSPAVGGQPGAVEVNGS